jgi:recombination protein RecA
MQRTKKPNDSNITDQVKAHANKPAESEGKEYEGDPSKIVTTGSTLLDLAISGGRVRGGGVPVGILVEIFGPSGTGKTTLLCELAGAVQRKGGEVLFHDPEGRLNKEFAEIFDFHCEQATLGMPNTVPQVFQPIREWQPESDGPNAVFADSLAALSTDAELDDNDAYGMRRAKEFSEECRKTCRILSQNNWLMVCSNQVRVNVGAGNFQEKYKSPGGEAIPFYASLRLKTRSNGKIEQKRTVKGKEVKRVIGVSTVVQVYKSSVWKPYREAEVPIIFDYGIDDVRANLQFVKQYTDKTIYGVRDQDLDNSLEKAIAKVEDQDLEHELKGEVIEVWQELERKFETERKPKRRD